MFIVANAGGDHNIEHFNQVHALMAEYDEPFQNTAPNEVPGLVPNVAFQSHSAIYMLGAMSVDTGSLLDGLQNALSRFDGAENIREKVVAIEKIGESWRLELSNQEVIKTDKVLLARRGAYD